MNGGIIGSVRRPFWFPVKFIFTITFFLFSGVPVFAELNKAQMWAISLTGIMTELNNSYRNSLNPGPMDEKGRGEWLEVLERDWGIGSREELLEMLDSLESGGHTASLREIQEIIRGVYDYRGAPDLLRRLAGYQWNLVKYDRYQFILDNWDNYRDRSIRAWDLGRCISLCRWAYNVDFITEEEAWEKIFYYAKLLQAAYASWKEYGEDYFWGRIFFASSFGEVPAYYNAARPVFEKLISGYWGRLDWYTDLDQREVEAAPEKIYCFTAPSLTEGPVQFLTNDPAMCNQMFQRYLENPGPDANVYQARVRKQSGSDTSGYGILFCVDDSNENNENYYRLLISVGGRFTVQKRINQRWQKDPVNWRDSSFINTGYNADNSLRVEREDLESGATFRVYLNDNLAVAFNDPDPVNGKRMGVIAGVGRMENELFPYIPVDVRFDR